MLKLPNRPRSFVDIETTGLSPKKHEIIEFAALKHYPEDDTVEFLELKIKPEHIESASPKALEINGYTERAWENAVPMDQAITQIVSFLKGSVIIGHNLRFDTDFIKVAAKRHNAARIPFFTIDTLELCREHLADMGLRKFSLTSVCNFLGISNQGAHTALADVVRCKEVFDKLLKLMK